MGSTAPQVDAFWCPTCTLTRWDILSRLHACACETLQERGWRGEVKHSSDVLDTQVDCAGQLARFFPEAHAVRVPVQIVALRVGARLREATVVEFGGSNHAIFVSTLPLEFDDHVRLEHDSRRHAPADATVVAVQYHEGKKAIAVKFNFGPCHWVTQP